MILLIAQVPPIPLAHTNWEFYSLLAICALTAWNAWVNYLQGVKGVARDVKLDRHGEKLEIIRQDVNSTNQAAIKAARDAASAAAAEALRVTKEQTETAYERGRSAGMAEVDAAVQRAWQHGREGLPLPVISTTTTGIVPTNTHPVR